MLGFGGLETVAGFNTQPPEGGWKPNDGRQARGKVSTHSRLKAAGMAASKPYIVCLVSTHSRLKAAGETSPSSGRALTVSTHSRLKAAGC